MRYIIAFFCLCLPALVHGADITASDRPLAQAHVIYREHFATSQPGVYEWGGIIFVVVEIARGNPPERILEILEGRAMLAFHRTLRAYIDEKHPPPDDPPPLPILITTFPELMPLLRTVEPQMGIFSWRETWQYKGSTRLLQNGLVGNTYRYVVAIPVTTLEDAIPDIQRDGPDAPAIERAVQKAWTFLKEKGKLAEICDLLSLPADHLRLANDELRRHVNVDSLYWGNVFSPRESQVVERRFTRLGDARPALGTMQNLSRGIPVSAYALAGWADSGDAPPWNTLNARLLTLDDEEIRPTVLAHLSKSENNSAGEYAEWLSELAARPLPGLLRNVDLGPVAMAAWKTLGHANFPVAAPDVETPEFLEAKELFAKGEELLHLTELLMSSVEKSPRHTASWVLLGSALRAGAEAEDAVWALTQALRLSPDNADARANLALVYQAANRPEWAAGMAASVLAMPDVSKWSREKAMEILEKHNLKDEAP